MNILNFIKEVFNIHKCKFEIVKRISNTKGEIWIEECSCGKKQRTIFDSNGNCVETHLIKN